MPYKVTQKSFTGGELSPALYARNNLVKYESGLKTLKNGFVRQEGCVSNRSGLELVGETKDSLKKSRLIPFSFNTEQTYMIEAGHKYFRFIKNGAYIVYPDDYGGSEELEPDIDIEVPVEPDIDIDDTEEKPPKEPYDPEKVAKRGLPVEIETPYKEEELSMLKFAQNADILTICHTKHEPMELSRYSHYDWELKTIYYAPVIKPPKNLKAVWSGSTANPRKYSYLVTAIDEETEQESNRSAVVEVNGRIESYWAVGEKMTISFDEVSKASEYNVYRSVNGIFGFIGTTTTTSFEDTKYEPDMSTTAPQNKNPFKIYDPKEIIESAGGGTAYYPVKRPELYPSVTNYFQQRKVYANSKAKPQTIWATQTGTSNNFNISSPLSATDAITLTISERQVNDIRHLVAMNDLIVFTSKAEWKVNGSDNIFSASPPPVPLIQSCHGCSHIPPIVSGNMIIFVQAGGSIVRDLCYTYVSDSYDGDELTIFANHLFEGKQIIDMDYSNEPYRIIWCILSDGKLAGLTYNRKQEVCGWHRHETIGNFESVAVIREGFEDIAYFIVQRNINNQVKRFVERMPSRIISNVSESFFVDCGLRYNGKPVKTVSGLEHLENETVIVCADGIVITDLIVKNGKINLHNAASNIVVGLPYEFELETLNIESENTFGVKKIINRVNFKVDKSREDFFVVGAEGTEIQNPRKFGKTLSDKTLFSGDVEAGIFSKPKEEATVHIKQKYPLPLTILSITSDVSIPNVA